MAAMLEDNELNTQQYTVNLYLCTVQNLYSEYKLCRVPGKNLPGTYKNCLSLY